MKIRVRIRVSVRAILRVRVRVKVRARVRVYSVHQTINSLPLIGSHLEFGYYCVPYNTLTAHRHECHSMFVRSFVLSFVPLLSTLSQRNKSRYDFASNSKDH